jgi:hypothetical protein
MLERGFAAWHAARFAQVRATSFVLLVVVLHDGDSWITSQSRAAWCKSVSM